MKYRLLLFGDHYGHDLDKFYSVIGENYDTRKQAEGAKRSFSFARSGIVNDARKQAAAQGLRTPWRIEEYQP